MMSSAIRRLLRTPWTQQLKRPLNIRSFPQQKVQVIFQPGAHRYLTTFDTRNFRLKEYVSQTQRLRSFPNCKAQTHSGLQSRRINQLHRPEPEFGDKELSDLPDSEEDTTEDFVLSPLQLDLIKAKYSSVFFLASIAGAYLYMNYPWKKEGKSKEDDEWNESEKLKQKDASKVLCQTHPRGTHDSTINLEVELQILGHSISVTR
jgi:hypothetical protein